jgi:hypothetical protein
VSAASSTPDRLWEIAENLHRADLTVAERAAHIAEWVRLTGENVKAQVAPLGKPHDPGRKNQGINAAVRELGIDRSGLLPNAAVRPRSRSSAKFLRG